MCRFHDPASFYDIEDARWPYYSTLSVKQYGLQKSGGSSSVVLVQYLNGGKVRFPLAPARGSFIDKQIGTDASMMREGTFQVWECSRPLAPSRVGVLSRLIEKFPVHSHTGLHQRRENAFAYRSWRTLLATPEAAVDMKTKYIRAENPVSRCEFSITSAALSVPRSAIMLESAACPPHPWDRRSRCAENAEIFSLSSSNRHRQVLPSLLVPARSGYLGSLRAVEFPV